MAATGDEFIIGELRKAGAEWLMDPSDEHQQAEAIRRLVAATAAAERERSATAARPAVEATLLWCTLMATVDGEVLTFAKKSLQEAMNSASDGNASVGRLVYFVAVWPESAEAHAKALQRKAQRLESWRTGWKLPSGA